MILRGSGPRWPRWRGSPPSNGVRSARTRRAAASSTSRREAAREKGSDRGGERRPARRLQPAQPLLVDRALPALSPIGRVFEATRRRGARSDGLGAARRSLPTELEWANDPSPTRGHSRSRRRPREAARIANERDLGARGRDRHRGRGGRGGLSGDIEEPRVLARDDAVHGRLRADGCAGDGDQRRLDAGPRGPVTYRDLWLRQYRVVGDGTQRGEAPVVVKFGSCLVVGAGRRGSCSCSGRAGVIAARPAARRSASSRPARSRSAPAPGLAAARAACRRCRPPRPRPSAAPTAWTRPSAATAVGGAGPPDRRRPGRSRGVPERSHSLRRCSGSPRCRL